MMFHLHPRNQLLLLPNQLPKQRFPLSPQQRNKNLMMKTNQMMFHPHQNLLPNQLNKQNNRLRLQPRRLKLKMKMMKTKMMFHPLQKNHNKLNNNNKLNKDNKIMRCLFEVYPLMPHNKTFKISLLNVELSIASTCSQAQMATQRELPLSDSPQKTLKAQQSN